MQFDVVENQFLHRSAHANTAQAAAETVPQGVANV